MMFDAELDTAPIAPVAAPPVVPEAPESPLASPAPDIAPDAPPSGVSSPSPSGSSEVPPVCRSTRDRCSPGDWWKVQHREPTPMIESSEDEGEADEDEEDNEEAHEDIPGAFTADLEPPEFTFVGPEPNSYRQALLHPDAVQWTKAAEEEIEAHLQNGTWELADLPAGHRAIGSRWVFKVKHTADGSIERYKAHLVAKGFQPAPWLQFQ